MHELPSLIHAGKPMHPDNIGGDVFALICITVAYWWLFYRLQFLSWNKFEQYLEGSWLSYFFLYPYPAAKSLEDL